MVVLRPVPKGVEPLRDELASALANENISSESTDRVAYARDLWPRQQIRTRRGEAAIAPPAFIAWPESTEEVARLVQVAHERSLPIVPYGAGSGVCGGILPREDALIIDMKRMRRPLEVDGERLIARFEAGIVGQHLEDELNRLGFTLGHFPSSIYCSTLGGWIAGRSAGQTSGRYGKIEDMILGLRFVDGTGKVHHVERDGENAALLPLIIGSEGILGIVTEATLRIAPAPEERVFAGFVFPDVASGLLAIRRFYQSGLRPAVARLYDPFDSFLKRQGGIRRRDTDSETEASRPKGIRGKTRKESTVRSLALHALNHSLRHAKYMNELIERVPDTMLGGATLVLVWECDLSLGKIEREVARAIALELGAEDLGEEPGRHWLAHRHSVSYRQSPMFRSGAFVDTMEVSARWSRMLPMYEAVKRALGEHVFVMAHFSHAYPDGASIYFTFAGSARSDAEQLERYDRAWRSALKAAIDAGGSLSHHHGVGRSKAPAMQREQGHALSLLADLKKTFDPRLILNRGTLLPEEFLHGLR